MSGIRLTSIFIKLGVTRMNITPARVGIITAAIVFAFFAAVMNSQPRGWLSWYQLARFGQVAQATVTARQPELHQRCSFRYFVEARAFEASEGGCHSEVGQSVRVTYLPSEPSFATLKSPQAELVFQVVAVVVMSAVAGVVSAWQSRRWQRSAAQQGAQADGPASGGPAA